MWERFVISQIFAIPLAWASAAAITATFNSTPWYVTVGVWGIVSLYVCSKVNEK
jgi:hypothetical protein